MEKYSGKNCLLMVGGTKLFRERLVLKQQLQQPFLKGKN